MTPREEALCREGRAGSVKKAWRLRCRRFDFDHDGGPPAGGESRTGHHIQLKPVNLVFAGFSDFLRLSRKTAMLKIRDKC
jgi:hypothetical protein